MLNSSGTVREILDMPGRGLKNLETDINRSMRKEVCHDLSKLLDIQITVIRYFSKMEHHPSNCCFMKTVTNPALQYQVVLYGSPITSAKIYNL